MQAHLEINNQKKICNILSIFHEGMFKQLKYVGKDVSFSLECVFLADMINDSFTHFYGVFKHCDDIYFQPWDDEYNIVNDLRDLENLLPDILNVDLEGDGYLKIYSNCMRTFTGGNLFIKARDIKIFDEDFNEINLEKLNEISEKYWHSLHKA